MKTIFVTLIIVVLFVAACSAEFIRGPFSGKVIDAETKEPIEGAVVVVVWRKNLYGSPGGPISYIHEIKETLTDKNGEYYIKEYKGFSINPLAKIKNPNFLIFKPGYCVLPKSASMPSCKDMKPRENYNDALAKERTLVELPKLKTREERLAVLVDPIGEKNDWKKQKQFIKLIREEWEFITGKPAGDLYKID